MGGIRVELGGARRRRTSGMAASPRADPRRAGGFTLLELAGVLVLVAVVTTVAIGAWFSRSDVTLRNAADLVASDLRHLQTRASVLKVPVEVVFHEDHGGYHGVELDPSGSARPEAKPLETRRYPVDAVFEDVRIGAVRLRHGERLVFDALGRPSSDASITLVHHGVAQSVLVDAHRARVAVEGQ